MPFDAIFLSAVTDELNENLAGCRVDKIHQPERDTLLLHLRSPRGSHKLLLTANPTRPRIQLTALTMANPAPPPMFCMLLRKHPWSGRWNWPLTAPMRWGYRERNTCTPNSWGAPPT